MTTDDGFVLLIEAWSVLTFFLAAVGVYTWSHAAATLALMAVLITGIHHFAHD